MKKTRIVHSVTAVVLSLLLMFSVMSISASAAGNTVTLTFNATVAKGIPQGTNISIGSSLNSWNPKDTNWYATQLDETHFSLVVSVSSAYIGQEIEYKWTLQYPDSDGNGWEYTENAAGTGLFGNRKIIVNEAGNIMNDTVSFPSKPEEVKSTVTGGKLETIQMKMPQFSDGRSRTIRVWLPDGYDANDSEKKYSVLYMHDGQNLFDAATSFLGEWEVDESLSKLMKDGYESTIVVGIDNGELERFNELCPSWELNALGKEYIAAPAGEKYADFIVNTVKPYIDEHYNTKPQREYTGIGGSSMGGIMSLYMAMEYSDVFDYSIIFSPAMHIYSDDVLDKFLHNYDFTSMSYLTKLYLFAGAKTGGSEPGSPYDEACITKYVDIIKNALTDRNYPEQLIGAKVDENEYHIESTWAKYFPIALQWLSSVEIPTTPSTTAPVTDKFVVTTTLNKSYPTETEVTGKTFTVTYNLVAPQLIADGQGIVTYDNTKLKLVSMELPKITSMLTINESSKPGTMLFNFSYYDVDTKSGVYDFTQGGEFVVLKFEVIGEGTASVDLTVEQLDSVDTIYFEDGVPNLPEANQVVSSLATPTVKSDTTPTETTTPTSSETTEPEEPTTAPTTGKTEPTEPEKPTTAPTTGKTEPTESEKPTTAPTTGKTEPTETPSPTNAPTTAQPTTAPTEPTTKSPTQPTTKATEPTTVQEFGKGADGKVVEKALTSTKSDGDPAGSTFNLLQVKNTKTTTKSIKLSYKKPSGTKKFVIYGAKCGSKYKVLKTTKAKSVKIKNLKKGKYYKFLVVALDKNGKVVATSKTIHVATNGGKYGNPNKVKITNAKKANQIKNGKTVTLKTKVKAAKNVTVKTHRKVKFESSNTKVATVTQKGKIKAKKSGKCTIYAYAQNGVMAKVKVTVK